MVAASTTCRGEDRYAKGYHLVWERIKELEGTAVDAKKNAEKITWKVVPEVSVCDDEEDGAFGVKEECDLKEKTLADTIFLLWPGDLWEQRDKMNEFFEWSSMWRKRKLFAANSRGIREVDAHLSCCDN